MRIGIDHMIAHNQDSYSEESCLGLGRTGSPSQLRHFKDSLIHVLEKVTMIEPINQRRRNRNRNFIIEYDRFTVWTTLSRQRSLLQIMCKPVSGNGN